MANKALPTEVAKLYYRSHVLRQGNIYARSPRTKAGVIQVNGKLHLCMPLQIWLIYVVLVSDASEDCECLGWTMTRSLDCRMRSFNISSSTSGFCDASRGVVVRGLCLIQVEVASFNFKLFLLQVSVNVCIIFVRWGGLNL